jgi:hypothetical protein
MSAYGSKDVGFLLVDGYDLLGYILGLDDGEVEAVLDDITALGHAWPVEADTGSAKSGGVSLDALYDDGALLTRDVFVTKQGVNRVLLWNVDGNVIGKRFQGYGGAVDQKHQRICADGKLHRAKATLTASGPVEDGIVLHSWLQETTASGNTQASSHDWTTHARAVVIPITSSSVANPSVITTPAPHKLTTGQKVLIAGHAGSTPAINGEQTVTVTGPNTFTIPVNVTVGGAGGTLTHASTVGGASGYFACNALTLGGYTDFTAKVRHSVDNATFADLITFTAISVAQKAERRVVAGTVNRYTASSYAFSGAGASPKATFVVGIARPEAQ